MTPAAVARRFSAALVLLGTFQLNLMLWWYPHADRLSTVAKQVAATSIIIGLGGLILTSFSFARRLKSFLNPLWLVLFGLLGTMTLLSILLLVDVPGRG